MKIIVLNLSVFQKTLKQILINKSSRYNIIRQKTRNQIVMNQTLTRQNHFPLFVSNFVQKYNFNSDLVLVGNVHIMTTYSIFDISCKTQSSLASARAVLGFCPLHSPPPPPILTLNYEKHGIIQPREPRVRWFSVGRTLSCLPPNRDRIGRIESGIMKV